MAGNVVEKEQFLSAHWHGFHTFRLIDDDDMLILMELFDQTRVSGWELFFRVIVASDQAGSDVFLEQGSAG